jgi:hypothetical protein
MPGLLTPAFLAGLAALAIPVLVHLVRRERREPIEFPSLMFLSRIPQPVVKRRSIRDRWLLALRALAIILLVGAFARPFVERPQHAAAADATAAREVVILVDRSQSMSHGDRWQRAVAAARTVIDGLGGSDRATLAFFDASAHVAAPSTTDRARLRQALDGAAPGAAATRYATALRVAESVLAASPLPRLEAVLISDFQRTGWEGSAGVRLPPGARLTPVPVGGDDVVNLVVTGVTLDRARVTGRERVTATAQLRLYGAQPVRAEVVLEVDGRTVQTQRVAVPAGGTAAVTFAPLTLGDAAARAVVRAAGEALSGAHAFHFVLAPEPGLRLLLVQPAGRDAGLYLRRALEIAHEAPVNIGAVQDRMPTAAELARADVVLLNDILPRADEAGRRLLAWVEAGGGVILAAGERTAAAPWSDVARVLAGGTPGRVADRVAEGGARLGYIDYSHPVFEPFRAPRAGGFGGARFYRYRAVPAADARAVAGDTASPAAAVLARFDDGGAALVERRVGRGRALVWGSTLDTYWTSLALEPVFLPLVHQLVRHAAGRSPQRPWHTVGQIVDVTDSPRGAWPGGEPGARPGAQHGAGDGALLVTAPSGRAADIDAARGLLTLAEPGFYEVRHAGTGGTTVALHAANTDAAEADLAPLDPDELAAAVTSAATAGREAAAVALPREEQERRQSLWLYLLITAFALVTAETVLANRGSRRAV